MAGDRKSCFPCLFASPMLDRRHRLQQSAGRYHRSLSLLCIHSHTNAHSHTLCDTHIRSHIHTHRGTSTLVNAYDGTVPPVFVSAVPIGGGPVSLVTYHVLCGHMVTQTGYHDVSTVVTLLPVKLCHLPNLSNVSLGLGAGYPAWPVLLN